MITHYTLNTGNSTTILQPTLFEIALQPGQTQLPEPYDRFLVNLSIDGSDAVFDVEIDGEKITLNTLAVNDPDNGLAEQTIETYELIYKKRPSFNPEQKPWLATIVLPSPKIFETQLSARIGQAIALSLYNTT